MTRSPLRFLVVSLALAASLAAPRDARAVPDDTVADLVFGQGGSFTSNTCNLGGISADSLCRPFGMAVDAAGNIYVADVANNRVLRYDRSPLLDATADRVFGQDDFTSAECTATLDGLCAPDAVAFDSAGNMYVSDFNNNRVLGFNSPLTTDAVADIVFGLGGGPVPGASDLNVPAQLAVDASGNLYVADNENSRVLEFDSPLSTDTVADRVFGQGGSFATFSCGGTSASSLCYPTGVALDSSGNLYVAAGNRVLVYLDPLNESAVADLVFGQNGSFSTDDCNQGGTSAASLCTALWLTTGFGDSLYIADTFNHRILEYNSPLTTDVLADRVFGQSSFAATGCGLGSNELCQPIGVATDSSGSLFVADLGNNRVVGYVAADADSDSVPTLFDNCPSISNPLQENDDSLRLGATSPKVDRTNPHTDAPGNVCDPDDDNDGSSDANESMAGTCPGLSYTSLAQCHRNGMMANPLIADAGDTDGDGFTDGAESLLASDPLDAHSYGCHVSYPVCFLDDDHDGVPDGIEATIGSSPALVDSDGDGLSDRVEFMHRATSPTLADTDGGGCGDLLEVLNLDGNGTLGFSDLLLLAASYAATGPALGAQSATWDANRDFNGNSRVDFADLLMLADTYGQSCATGADLVP